MSENMKLVQFTVDDKREGVYSTLVPDGAGPAEMAQACARAYLLQSCSPVLSSVTIYHPAEPHPSQPNLEILHPIAEVTIDVRFEPVPYVTKVAMCIFKLTHTATFVMKDPKTCSSL